MNILDSAPDPEALSSHDISVDGVLAQLSRLTASRTFENTPVLRNLLEHLVTRTISAQSHELKEYSLGIDVFGRGASFDPRVDTIVRVQARRLRTRLAVYYDSEGGSDPVVIELPKGHYVPTFRKAAERTTQIANGDPVDSPRASSRWWVGLAPGLLIGAALMFVLRGTPASTVRDREIVSAAAAMDSDALRAIKVVVTPFENHTGEAALDGLGLRVAEQVIAGIATVEHAAVAAQPSAAPAGANGHADLVVTGTYYTNAETLEFRTRIVEARSGRLLHGFATMAASKADVVAALESVRESVAGAIAVHQDDFFGGLDVISHPPTLEAYREYRAGLEIFQSDYARTLSHLRRSHELAPQFLPPLVVMIFSYGNLGQPDKNDAVLAVMEGLSDRLTTAERLVVEFLRSNRHGRREQARRLLEELERLMPASLLINHNLIQAYAVANRPRAAVAAYLRHPSVGRDLRHSVGNYRRMWFLNALHMLGEYERELEESRRAQADAPGVLVYVRTEARALIGLGRAAEVQDIVERSLSLPRTIGWTETPGDVLELTAVELRAHGYRQESAAMTAKGVEWYRGRPAQSTTARELRDGLAEALYLSERWHEAGTLFEGLASEFPTYPPYRARVAQIAAYTGDPQRARLISDELATWPVDRGWVTSVRAGIAAALGERERAVQMLRDAFMEGLPYGPHLHQNVDFEILRDDEAYRRLLRPVG